MKTYHVRGPCPELSTVVIKAYAEAGEGEVVKIVSQWRYVLNDLKNAAGQLGFEVVEVRDLGSEVEVLLRKSTRGRPLSQAPGK